MQRAELTCPQSPEGVATARAFVAATLAGWGAADYEWPAVLLVSELATNAVLHAQTPYEVRLILAEGLLTIEVADGSPATPARRRYGNDATTGRGMRMVADLCDGWQVDLVQPGKVVRCSLPRQRRQHDDNRTQDLRSDADLDAALAAFPDDGSAADQAAMYAGRQQAA